jgi:DNA-binding response OmpR family regulator
MVEDETSITEPLAAALAREGWDSEVAATAAAGLELAERVRPELVLLDVMLPDGSGYDVCRELRRRSDVPIIMLTARGEEADRVRGLELGADDYVTKPFSPKELVARVTALIRRSTRASPPLQVLRYGSLTVDIDQHQVKLDDQEVRLTAKEFLLLRYLIEHRGRVLSRDRLLTDVWGYQYTGGTRTVDVHVRRLREKLPMLETALATVKQFGYKLEEPPAVAP